MLFQHKTFPLLSLLLGSSLVTTTFLTSSPVVARPSFPITKVIFFNQQNAEFTVPDENTTTAAGNVFRRYDAHIAKMFELTLYECQDSNLSNSHVFSWNYQAGNGNIDMGIFKISCALARNLVAAYGLGQSEPTDVYYYRVRDVINVPKFNIVGDKVPTWLQFVQTFKPVSTDNAVDDFDVIISLVTKRTRTGLSSIPVYVRPIHIIGNYSLASYNYGDGGGQYLLKKENGQWRIVFGGGGSIQDVPTLMRYGVPRDIAEQLADGIDI